MSRLNNIVLYLVDDNDIDIAVNTKLLQLAQISNQIHTFNNAGSFLDEVKAHPDQFENQDSVLLLDIMMPSINGFECLDQLKAMAETIRDRIKVFMLSSSIDRNDIRRAEEYQMVQRVLEKPLDIYALKKSLEFIYD